MRLRLYRLDGNSAEESRHRPLLIDRFPFTISDPTDWTPICRRSAGIHDCCRIDLFGDTLFVTDISPDESTHVNGRSVTVAPMLPGDRIKLSATEFLVSYERMSSAPPASTEFLLQNMGEPRIPLSTQGFQTSRNKNVEKHQNAFRDRLPVESLT